MQPLGGFASAKQASKVGIESISLIASSPHPSVSLDGGSLLAILRTTNDAATRFGKAATSAINLLASNRDGDSEDSVRNSWDIIENRLTEGPMAFKPNYNQQRAERNRAKAQKKEEKLQRREAESAKRKAEREQEPSPDGTPEQG